MSDIMTFAAIDGTRLAYRDFGPSHGRTIVLCHGLGANGEQFLDDAEDFAARGFRVIVPDVRGHGASSALSGYPLPGFAIPVLASDMAALLDAAGTGPVHWVGNSLGGIVAFQLVSEQPQRFISLSTFGTAHSLKLPGFSADAIPAIYRLVGKRFAGWSTALGTTANKAARPLVARMLEAHDPQVGRAVAHNVRNYDLTDAALSYAGPMLLLRGGRDHAVNQALAATLPRFEGRANFSRVDLPKGGHMANLDAKDEWRAALLDFWARVEALVP